MSVVLLICIFLSFSAFSEDLESIEVQSGKDLSEFNLGSSESLNEYDLEKENSALLSESLDNLSGVTPSHNGGPGGRVSYFIRGTEARHVSFTIDSLRINDTSNTDRQFDSAFLSSAFLSNVTLYKGPQAVLFGSDAMGGLFDMKTRKGEHAPETRLSVNGGSFGTYDSSLSHDWKAQNHQGTLTWSSMRTDGLSHLNKKRFDATERDGADMTQLTSSSRHRWADKWQTDILFSFLRGNNELDGRVKDNDNDESRNDQYMAQQKTSYELNTYSAISLRNGLSRHQRNIKTEAVGFDQYEGDLIQNEFLFDYEKDRFHFLSGLASEHETYQQRQLERAANLHSLFMQMKWGRNGLTLQSGLRMENHSRYGNFQTGSAGMGYTHGSETLTLQYSQGFKAPSLYQLYGLPVFGFPVGNKELVPERNHAYEARWLHALEDLKTEVALFQNRLSNLITYGNTGYLNQGRFTAQGIEASADWTLDKFRFKPTYMQQEFKDEITPVLRRPLRQYRLELAYFPFESWELFMRYKHYDARKDIDENGSRVKLSGFETLDLGTRLISGKNDYGLQLINIFDRNYEELYGYSVLPLSIFFHYGRTF